MSLILQNIKIKKLSDCQHDQIKVKTCERSQSTQIRFGKIENEIQIIGESIENRLEEAKRRKFETKWKCGNNEGQK